MPAISKITVAAITGLALLQPATGMPVKTTRRGK